MKSFGEFKDEDQFLREFEVGLKVLNNVVRMKILRSISREAKSVGQIAKELGISSASCSVHLNMLWRSGFVRRLKIGNKVFYSLNVDFILEMQKMVRRFLGIE